MLLVVGLLVLAGCRTTEPVRGEDPVEAPVERTVMQVEPVQMEVQTQVEAVQLMGERWKDELPRSVVLGAATVTGFWTVELADATRGELLCVSVWG